MRVELPSGHWAELRDADQLIARDARVAKAAFGLVLREDGARELTGDLTDKVKYAILKEVITGWDFVGLPLPRDAVDPDGVMGNLPLKDINALLAAIEPHFNEIMEVESPKAEKEVTPPPTASSSATGSSVSSPAGESAGPLTTTSTSGSLSPSDGAGPQTSATTSP